MHHTAKQGCCRWQAENFSTSTSLNMLLSLVSNATALIPIRNQSSWKAHPQYDPSPNLSPKSISVLVVASHLEPQDNHHEWTYRQSSQPLGYRTPNAPQPSGPAGQLRRMPLQWIWRTRAGWWKGPHLADPGLQGEDGLVDLRPQVDAPVLQPGVDRDGDELGVRAAQLLLRPGGVHHLEGQRLRTAHAADGDQVQLGLSPPTAHISRR